MKLIIGDNIRKYRRVLDLTQEELAERLGVSFQTVSRWENGGTYPDIELLPVLARTFSVTLDALLGMAEEETVKAFRALLERLGAALRVKSPDPEAIITDLRTLRRDYPDMMNREGMSTDYYRLFRDITGGTAWKDASVMAELRGFGAYLLRDCTNKWIKSSMIETLAAIEDDAHVEAFITDNATDIDLSEDHLRARRYKYRREWDKLEDFRQHKLMMTLLLELFDEATWRDHTKAPSAEHLLWMTETCITLIHNIRRVTPDSAHPISGNGEVDLWCVSLTELGMQYAAARAATGDREGAFTVLEDTVALMERAMALPDGTELRSSCPALDRIVCRTEHRFFDELEEEHLFIQHQLVPFGWSIGIGPVDQYRFLTSDRPWNGYDPAWLDPIRDDTRYADCVARIGALVKRKPEAR
ncbi:MAG: helix-turn-helix transcriptional regulator [Clostridia bacterium]|nr:helix-turn-helix transcriptional regulator [Clostridia bacterium]